MQTKKDGEETTVRKEHDKEPAVQEERSEVSSMQEHDDEVSAVQEDSSKAADEKRQTIYYWSVNEASEMREFERALAGDSSH